MNNVKKMLKLSSTINFIIGVSVLLFSYTYSAFFFALGFLFLVFSNYTEEELQKNKTLILILGIITIPLNFITGTLAIIASDKINEVQKDRENYLYTVSNKNTMAISSTRVLGNKFITIPVLGKILEVVESKVGFIFFVLFPIIIVFIYQLYQFIVMVKYESN